MRFTLAEGYEPGHIEMFYGNNLTDLATLEPENPKDGDFRAMYTVNGEWRFRLTGNGEETLTDPGDITPELEALLKGDGRMDGATFIYRGVKTTIEWVNNNWFEVFVDVYEGGEWVEHGFELDEGPNVGPTPEEMRLVLEESIQMAKDGCSCFL